MPRAALYQIRADIPASAFDLDIASSEKACIWLVEPGSYLDHCAYYRSACALNLSVQRLSGIRLTTRAEQTNLQVIRGGTAGFGAAIAVGWQGLDVTLLEATNKIGGVMAFCLGMPWVEQLGRGFD